MKMRRYHARDRIAGLWSWGLLGLMRSPCVLAVSVLLMTALTGCSSPPEDAVEVLAGDFLMGSNDVDTEAKALQYGSKKPWYANEGPQRKVFLKRFFIDKFEVTNSKYKEFVDAKGKKPPAHWKGNAYPPHLAELPVVLINWQDAQEYCNWRGKRLPTEAEWEKAARGTDGRSFPWGNIFDIKKVNTLGEYGGMTPTGTFKDGVSAYGAFDMAGNAQEWTSDWYLQYPGNTFKDDAYGEKLKIVRGGGWGGMGHYTLQVYVRTSFRGMAPPAGAFDDVGFRCVWPK
ncbi:MAG: SUMF1/EgtB/PvdO family nonheme iron enzyme [Deltaproteobacteria bacterium]|nr:SUMF1/EgtB/PvdO family nonheme iron enzyme [Deltaproteobacteria bacterium]